MRKKEKKLIYILILLIICVIVLIMAFASFQNSSSSTNTTGKNGYKDEKYIPSISYGNQENKYQPNVLNKEYSYLDSKDRENLDERIDWLIENINEKSYQTIYDKLTDNYKKMRFPTLEDLEKFLDEKFPNGCAFSSFRLDTYSCIVSLAVKDASGEEKVEVYLRGYEENSSLIEAIYFEEIIEIERTFGQITVPEMLAEIEYIVKCREKTITHMTLQNRTNHAITVDFSDSKMIRIYAGSEKSYAVLGEAKVTIKAGEKANLDITFVYPGASIYPADSTFYRFTIDGKKYTNEMVTVYEEEEIY